MDALLLSRQGEFTNVSRSWHKLSATQEIWFSATSSALGPPGNPKAIPGCSFLSLQAMIVPRIPKAVARLKADRGNVPWQAAPRSPPELHAGVGFIVQ